LECLCMLDTFSDQWQGQNILSGIREGG